MVIGIVIYLILAAAIFAIALGEYVEPPIAFSLAVWWPIWAIRLLIKTLLYSITKNEKWL